MIQVRWTSADVDDAEGRAQIRGNDRFQEILAAGPGATVQAEVQGTTRTFRVVEVVWGDGGEWTALDEKSHAERYR